MQKWHVHHGYLHSENSEKLHDPLIADDKKLLEKERRYGIIVAGKYSLSLVEYLL